MIKEYIIIILIISVIVGGHFLQQNHLNTTSVELIDDIDEIIEEIETNGEITPFAKEKIEVLVQDWEEVSKIWSIMVLHSELDQIELSLAAAKIAIENDIIHESLTSLSSLSFLLEHIQTKESLQLKNIL